MGTPSTRPYKQHLRGGPLTGISGSNGTSAPLHVSEVVRRRIILNSTRNAYVHTLPAAASTMLRPPIHAKTFPLMAHIELTNFFSTTQGRPDEIRKDHHGHLSLPTTGSAPFAPQPDSAAAHQTPSKNYVEHHHSRNTPHTTSWANPPEHHRPVYLRDHRVNCHL